MKKLALVLGSLLVVGSVASAKEAMPAPVAEPEVRIVEKPVEVIVYRDRMVEAPKKWRPNGYVQVMTKTEGEIESTKSTDDRTWDGEDYRTRVELKANVNMTENQNLEFRMRDWQGITKRNNSSNSIDEYYVQHTYNFGKTFGKVGMSLESRFTAKDKNKNAIRERLYFDFTDYLFSNKYVKTTNAVLAPAFVYNWNRNAHDEVYGLYADYSADIIGGFDFEAEFDNLYSYGVKHNPSMKSHTGGVELTLRRPIPLYAAGKHKLQFIPKAVYETSWAYNKKSIEQGDGGIVRNNGKKERWGDYTAKLETELRYTYKPTEYVDVMFNLGGQYVNRNEARHSASHWRWQPYADLGVKVTF